MIYSVPFFACLRYENPHLAKAKLRFSRLNRRKNSLESYNELLKTNFQGTDRRSENGEGSLSVQGMFKFIIGSKLRKKVEIFQILDTFYVLLGKL